MCIGCGELFFQTWDVLNSGPTLSRRGHYKLYVRVARRMKKKVSCAQVDKVRTKTWNYNLITNNCHHFAQELWSRIQRL
jgi:hypothetical protein